MKEKNMKKMKKGQTMVEYILIISLIAIALIGTFTLLKDKIRDKAEDAAEQIEDAGND
jgi:Flp pilus assembly pilin Flp